jgi:hypothetical protein
MSIPPLSPCCRSFRRWRQLLIDDERPDHRRYRRRQRLVEIATLEGINGITCWPTPAGAVLFGSYFPLYAFEAAKLKLQESALGEVQRAAIALENAKRLRGSE